MAKKNKKSYTYDQKVKILQQLERDKMNYTATSKVFGVTRQTLYNWVDAMGADVFKGDQDPMVEVTEAVEDFTGEARTEYRKRLEDAKMIIINRIIGQAKQEKNLDNLQKALRTIHELENTDNPPLGSKKIPGQGNMTFLQYINQQIINNEPQKIESNETRKK